MSVGFPWCTARSQNQNVNDMTYLRNIKHYGTVEDKVHSIVDGMDDDVEYLFMNWAQANVAFDKIEKPTIVYVLPPSGSLNFTYARVRDKPETQIAFLAPTDLDFDGHDNDNVIERMKRLCIKFVKAFNDSGLFEIIDGNLPYRVVYDYLDQNVTGVSIEPPLIEEDGVIICDGEERAEDEYE